MQIKLGQLERISFNRYRVYKADPPIAINDNSRTIKLYFVADGNEKKIEGFQDIYKNNLINKNKIEKKN